MNTTDNAAIQDTAMNIIMAGYADTGEEALKMADEIVGDMTRIYRIQDMQAKLTEIQGDIISRPKIDYQRNTPYCYSEGQTCTDKFNSCQQHIEWIYDRTRALTGLNDFQILEVCAI